METFYINYGGSLKYPILRQEARGRGGGGGWRVYEKPINSGKSPKKGDLDGLHFIRGDLTKKRRLITQCTL